MKKVLVLLVLVAAVVGGAVLFWDRALDVEVTVDDAGGLQAGDPVLYKGIRIGTVEAVGLRNGQASIRATIDQPHRESVRRGALFMVQGPGLLSNTPRSLQLADAGEGPALEDGATLKGTDAIGMLGRKARRAVEGFKVDIAAVLEGFGGALEPPPAGPPPAGPPSTEAPPTGGPPTGTAEGNNPVRKAEDLAEGALRSGADALRHAKEAMRQGLEAARKTMEGANDTLPEVRTQLEQAEKHLRAAGKTAEADKIKEALERLGKELE